MHNQQTCFYVFSCFLIHSIFFPFARKFSFYIFTILFCYFVSFYFIYFRRFQLMDWLFNHLTKGKIDFWVDMVVASSENLNHLDSLKKPILFHFLTWVVVLI